MEIETLIEGFRLYNSCKGLSPKTITWYDAFSSISLASFEAINIPRGIFLASRGLIRYSS